MNRILLLIKGLGRGGSEQLLASAAPHLDRTRFRYEIAYLLPWKDALVQGLRSDGFAVHCLDGARGPAWMTRLRSLVREHQIDLVHVHSPYAAIGARSILARRGGPRIVYTEHNVWERYQRATYWGNLLTFPRNDHVFTVSKQVQRSIVYPKALRFLQVPPTETLYHGIDPASVGWQSRDEGRQEVGVGQDVPIVGTVANFKAHKGHAHLLETVLHVRRAMPEVRFVLVGQGPLEAGIRRQAHRLGLDGTVVFTGFREDALRLVAGFDIFALPSLHDGLSIALVEAMALGKPCVITRVGGNPEVVEHGKHGLVVPPGDPRALADALLTLLRDRPLRERLGREAQARAAVFDIRASVRRMEQVYQELNERQAPRPIPSAR
jgi:glycosyltransferase involved in cell wall biosynthesis